MQRGQGGVSKLFCADKQQNNSHAGAKNAQLTACAARRDFSYLPPGFLAQPAAPAAMAILSP